MRDIVVGNGENEVPIRKLRMTMMKLPKTITAQGCERARRPAEGADVAAPDAEGRHPEEHAPVNRCVPGSARPLAP